MEKTHPSHTKTVAVVGTGMAGLATAHLLHQDPQKRYQVTLIEKRDEISLSAESVQIPSQDPNGPSVWADVPMRAFAGGFYRNLVRMYDYLGVKYHEQPFLFSFTKLPKRQQSSSTTSCIPGPQMVYASNFHQIPPIPRTSDLIHWCVEAVYAVLCYLWFTFCCFFIAPYAENLQTGQLSETFDHYLRRVWVPQHYVANYLLPLISSVCTCSHQELLNFPASDVLEYKRRTHRQQHFVVSAGVQCVQPKLLEGVELRLGVNLTHVIPRHNGVQIKYSTEDGKHSSEYFDLVVLAVSPDVAASLFPAVNSQLSAIPTTTVETVAHTDESTIRPMLSATANPTSIKCSKELRGSYNLGTQRIHLLSNGTITEAVHEQSNSILVTTNPLFPLDKSKIIRSASFIRVLRSPLSRLLVNSIFQDRGEPKKLSESTSAVNSWRNGDNGVYLAGGWCWDGMVLLEGCIVSAMRVATDLGVAVPWDDMSS
ncbi:uncharacterized protein N7473_013044 [Penicillium subrubescens]|uniref:Amine oxidase domain-containing protein n=1 Tax=Penicillium subrubescens TaxID=1316194 RepID=A0A1Q5U3D8_9EURO|nr:uncharacterized protein N7473_013044 [Penicillium subrubescens]KAJ5875697.1 hypothetical protein N7473_013044 [Penicillium subrubescens]OKP06989.1 hypothetical protein PENSUB_6172 [Penicillium subrubescens]